MFDTIETREIGPYIVHELIGWGGMSRVYHATDTSRRDADVAIKVLSDSVVGDREYRRRFIREIEIASSLEHPYILPVLDYGGDKGLLFMVMPLVRKGTLGDLIKDHGPLTPYQASVVATQVGAAIDYAHNLQIIHRDLKPHNIMLMDDGSYALADFGLGRLIHNLGEITATGRVLGSPMYMSPEQARGGLLGFGSDLYSFGVVLYECLLGRLPFNPRSLLEYISQHATARPLLPSALVDSFPPAIEAVLLRILEKSPESRYLSATALAEDLAMAVARLAEADQHMALITPEQISASKPLINTSTRNITPNINQAEDGKLAITKES